DLDGYWVHLDVDILDPSVMPAVDSPDPGGLSAAELTELLAALAPRAVGAQVTVFDPDLDPDGSHARLLTPIPATALPPHAPPPPAPGRAGSSPPAPPHPPRPRPAPPRPPGQRGAGGGPPAAAHPNGPADEALTSGSISSPRLLPGTELSGMVAERGGPRRLAGVAGGE